PSDPIALHEIVVYVRIPCDHALVKDLRLARCRASDPAITDDAEREPAQSARDAAEENAPVAAFDMIVLPANTPLHGQNHRHRVHRNLVDAVIGNVEGKNPRALEQAGVEVVDTDALTRHDLAMGTQNVDYFFGYLRAVDHHRVRFADVLVKQRT